MQYMDRDVPAWVAAPLDRAAAAFRAQFGREPTHAAAAPGRVNLIGEHTDYNGGFVLPIAIDRVCVAVGAPSAEAGRSRFIAADVGQAFSLEMARVGPDPVAKPGTWMSYVEGVARLMGRLLGGDQEPSIDSVFSGNIPIGGGLSSSAALEVSAASLIECISGREVSPVEKARLCRAAEREFAGVPCGIMDQFASVLGRAGQAMLIDCRSEEASFVELPPTSEAVLVVADSRVKHSLTGEGAGGEYAKRRKTCEQAAARLGVESLRSVEDPAAAKRGVLTDEQSRCVRHVVTENARTLRAFAALRAGELGVLGAMMNASHDSLREDYRVSCVELDTLVRLARSVPGVLGARMTGGGFGGCIVVLASPRAMVPLTAALSDGYHAACAQECGVFAVQAVDGVRRVLIPRGPG